MAKDAQLAANERLSLGLETNEHNRNLRANPQCVAAFTRQLALMFRSGIPLVRCLEVLSFQPDDPALAEAVSTIQGLVSRGTTLSVAFAKFPRIFGRTYHRLVAVAEATGTLDRCLEQLADWSERDQVQMRRLKSALTYPAALLVAAVLFTVSLFLWVFPGIVPILEGFGVALPWNTRLLIFLTRLVAEPTFWLGTGALLIPLGWKLYQMDDSSPLYRDVWLRLSRVPIVGHLLRTGALIRYVQAFAVMSESGLTVSETCMLAAQASGSPQILNDVQRLCGCIVGGQTLSEGISSQPEIYGPWLIQVAKVGEESASMGARLHHMVRVLEEDFASYTGQLIQLAEPITLSGLSAVIAFAMVSIFLPLYSYLGRL